MMRAPFTRTRYVPAGPFARVSVFAGSSWLRLLTESTVSSPLFTTTMRLAVFVPFPVTVSSIVAASLMVMAYSQYLLRFLMDTVVVLVA